MYSQTNEVKVALVGETGVGKTCIALRFISNSFNVSTPSTSGAAFMRKTMIIEGQAVKFQIWDTAGQEKFRSLTPMYYRSAGAVIIVFDVTRAQTFEDVKFWVGEIQQKGTPGAIIAILGNKIDKDGRQVSADSAEQYSRTISAQYYECSALTGEGVEKAFVELGKKKMSGPIQVEPKPDVIQEPKERGKGGCC